MSNVRRIYVVTGGIGEEAVGSYVRVIKCCWKRKSTGSCNDRPTIERQHVDESEDNVVEIGEENGGS